MAYLISDAKTDLTGMLHSTDATKVKNLYHAFWRAARKVLALIDPPETIRISQISNAVYDDIYDYSAPNDLKGKKIIDIRPQVNRTKANSFSQRNSREFDKYKDIGTIQVRNNKGTKSLRMAANITGSPITLHTMDSVTGNGTWAVGGDASNLAADEIEYLSGNASLQFDLSGAIGSGYIEISDMTDVDLTNYDETGAIFVRVYIPDADTMTNVILRWGNDTSNYWSRTVTAPHDQSAFKDGWNILRFDWDGATETGTVTPSAIDYLRVTLTSTVDTNFRVDKISCANGKIHEIEYYSEFLFSDTTGATWKAKPTDETDIVNLDEDGYNIFLYESMIEACQQMAGEDSQFDMRYAKEQLYGDGSRENMGLYHKYRVDHSSQALKPREYYYRVK